MEKSEDFKLITRAISGVLRNAQEGELPLFAWTLGQPQSEFISMLRQCFPELDGLEEMPEHQYRIIKDPVPAVFSEMVSMLIANCTPSANPSHVAWLARSITAASLGSRDLWQDLGLMNNHDVAALLKSYFYPLYERNNDNLNWKRFIYAAFGAAQASADKKLPECSKCSLCKECSSK
jgi:nitrogen fixation protein NifQ